MLNFQRRRDRAAAVGAAFKDVVDSLASDNATLRMAAAILLRRFFDTRSEQGAAGLSYASEALAVIAALLRESSTGPLQKVLADGLRYAPSLAKADLQGCNLTSAYLGQKAGDTMVVDLTDADLFKANLPEASLKGVKAPGAVFFGASLINAVLSGTNLAGADFRNADLTGADFRNAELSGARFGGAAMEGARFTGALHAPAEVAAYLDKDSPETKAGPLGNG